MDMIVCINFIESRKHNVLTLETYTGKVPKLKSKLFSGPLRKVNIDTLDIVANMTQIELNRLRRFLHGKGNIQINKYQYLINNANLFLLCDQFVRGVFFYKDKEKIMPLIEEIKVERGEVSKETQSFAGLKHKCIHNTVSIVTDCGAVQNVVSAEMRAVMYINLEEKKYQARLFFEYDNFEIVYGDRNRLIEESAKYRDYSFEQDIVTFLRDYGWHYKNNDFFEYCGENINESIQAMQEKGIGLYTNRQKPISRGNLVNCSMNYGIDWFELHGQVQAADRNYDLSKIINLTGRKKNWVEIDGNVIFLPESLQHIEFPGTIKCENDKLKLDRQEIPEAFYLAGVFKIERIENIEKLFLYEDVTPKICNTIYRKLRSYQKSGVKWLLYLYENKFGGCLADDMGLGKTFQIIAYLSDQRFSEAKSLIVVPKTLLINWSREIEKFSDSLSVYVYYGSKRDCAMIGQTQVVLTTYGTVINDFEAINQIDFTNLIVDEAQTIKNNKTKAYRILNRISARTRIVLTGTPLENGARELCSLMKFVNPGIFPSFEKISRQYEGEERLVLAVRRMSSPFLLRRMKAEVLSDLPVRQEQTIYCQMENRQEELYKNILKSVQYEIERNAGCYEIKSNAVAVLEGLLYLQEVCCHPALLPKEINNSHCLESAKLDLLKELLEKLYAAEHKVVIFSRFTRMLKLIEKWLSRENYIYFYLDGKTKKRQKIVDEFEQSRRGVFLISLRTGGTGLNLISSDTAIIYDPWWNPAVEQQAGDRIYRIGQKKDVTIYKLIVAGTIEEKIQQLQDKKEKMAMQILENQDSIAGITMERLSELLTEER